MPHQHVLNTLLGKAGSKDDHYSMLQKAVSEYPYWSVGHFLLLKETGLSNADYEKIAARTALHFDNPFLLNYLLNKKIPEKKLAPVVSLTASQSIPLKEADELNPQAPKVEPVNISEINTGEKKEDKPSPANMEELLFEPLHTTDYFASQGIKLSEEAQTSDKLGKQLKSFTEWLKTMKKVHEGKISSANENMDIAVQRLAEKSNKEDEVLTEAMAEVYMQQGKLKKATEIYEKLSLLYPGKSGYFAAKIEILKKN